MDEPVPEQHKQIRSMLQMWFQYKL